MVAMVHKMAPGANSRVDPGHFLDLGKIKGQGKVTASLRPLLALSKAIGLFPAQNVFFGRRRPLRFKLFSVEVLWSVLVFGALCFSMIRWMWNRTVFVSNSSRIEKTDLLVENVFSQAQGLEGLVILLVMMAKTSSVCKLLSCFDDYENDLQVGLMQETPSLFQGSKNVLCVIGISVLVSQGVSLFIYISLPEPNTYDVIFVSLFAIFTVIETLPCVQMGLFVELLCLRFRSISASILSMFPRPGENQHPLHKLSRICNPQDASRLEHLRLLLQRACRLVDLVSGAYGAFILVHYTLVLVLTITATYAILFSYSFRGIEIAAYSAAGVDFIMITRLVSATLLLSRIPKEASASLDELREVSLLNLDPDCRHQLEQLLQRLASCPPQMTASNFFTISRSLLTSMVASATTYLVVLIQFRMGDIGSKKCNSTEES